VHHKLYHLDANELLVLAPNKSILDFVLPDSQKSCSAFPTQNTFALDCQASSDLWVFVPVKVVHLRRGDIVYDVPILHFLSFESDCDSQFEENRRGFPNENMSTFLSI
jgi:hypothetical protein